LKACSFIGLVYSVIACVILFVFGKQFTLLFIDGKEVEIIRNSAFLLKCVSAFYFPLALVNIVRFTIQGLGFSKLAIIAGVCEMVARAIVGFGFTAACFASPVAWIMADIFLVPAYFLVIKSLKKKQLYQKSAGVV